MSSGAVLNLLAVLVLLPLLDSQAAVLDGGYCGFPPYFPNAVPSIGRLKDFPEKKIISYQCKKGYAKIPGKTNTVVCLANKQWSKISVFCNRSCSSPPVLRIASYNKSAIQFGYFPVGFTVEYQCRPGFQRNFSVSAMIVCLIDVTWSNPPKMCKRKLCSPPGSIKHGHVNVTDTYFGSEIFFSCEEGFSLEGVTSTFCAIAGASVSWKDPLPQCKEIFCPEPPDIENGKITKTQNGYSYGQSITYQCNENFTLLGNNTMQCSVKNLNGLWTGALPRCKELFCPEPPHIDHGKVIESQSHYRYGQSVTYKCNEGFTLAGNNSIQCIAKDDQAQWSGVPQCKERLALWPAVAPQKHATSTAQAPSTAPNTMSAKVSGAIILASGKFDSPAAKRKCHHCGMYNPYSWKRILSFNCLRSTIEMRCLWVPKRKWVTTVQHVLWKPLSVWYVPKYSQPCPCAKVTFGQLQIVRVNHVLLRARCLDASF
ncbi:complement decay-accelerating factor isoform X10 [Tenrec ecaudatus]|uniref:complement decay-accelerating factor isoform X10 n=1 Tax=Tenrec ecaudatus TaxID=94439 RepID=UPI003F5A21FC